MNRSVVVTGKVAWAPPYADLDNKLTHLKRLDMIADGWKPENVVVVRLPRRLFKNRVLGKHNEYMLTHGMRLGAIL